MCLLPLELHELVERRQTGGNDCQSSCDVATRQDRRHTANPATLASPHSASICDFVASILSSVWSIVLAKSGDSMFGIGRGVECLSLESTRCSTDVMMAAHSSSVYLVVIGSFVKGRRRRCCEVLVRWKERRREEERKTLECLREGKALAFVSYNSPSWSHEYREKQIRTQSADGSNRNRRMMIVTTTTMMIPYSLLLRRRKGGSAGLKKDVQQHGQRWQFAYGDKGWSIMIASGSVRRSGCTRDSLGRSCCSVSDILADRQ